MALDYAVCVHSHALIQRIEDDALIGLLSTQPDPIFSLKVKKITVSNGDQTLGLLPSNCNHILYNLGDTVWGLEQEYAPDGKPEERLEMAREYKTTLTEKILWASKRSVQGPDDIRSWLSDWSSRSQLSPYDILMDQFGSLTAGVLPYYRSKFMPGQNEDGQTPEEYMHRPLRIGQETISYSELVRAAAEEAS